MSTLRVQVYTDEDGRVAGIYDADEKWRPLEDGQGYIDVPLAIVQQWRTAAAAFDAATKGLSDFIDSIEPEGHASKADWEERHLADGNVTEEQYRARVAGCEHPVLERYSYQTLERFAVDDGRGICATCGTFVRPKGDTT